MKVSIELTLLPLQDNFEEHIIKFIQRLRSSEFKVLENPMSTQIYGDFKTLMPFLNSEIELAFKNQENVVVNLKIVKSDRSNYEPNF